MAILTILFNPDHFLCNAEINLLRKCHKTNFKHLTDYKYEIIIGDHCIEAMQRVMGTFDSILLYYIHDEKGNII